MGLAPPMKAAVFLWASLIQQWAVLLWVSHSWLQRKWKQPVAGMRIHSQALPLHLQRSWCFHQLIGEGSAMPLEMSTFCSIENKKKQEDRIRTCTDILLECPIPNTCRGSFTQMHLLKAPNIDIRVLAYAWLQTRKLCTEKPSLGEKYQARSWPALLSANVKKKKCISQEAGWRDRALWLSKLGGHWIQQTEAQRGEVSCPRSHSKFVKNPSEFMPPTNTFWVPYMCQALF